MKKEFPIKPEPIKEGKTKSNTKKNNGKGRQAGPPPTKVIPMYDPQTGEPNPHYEELTGKKNPLAILRETAKLENEILVPVNFQPVLRNRFMVKFPESLDIKPFMVTEVTLPVVSILKARQPGLSGLFSSMPSMKISDLEVKLIDSVTNPKLHKLHSIMRDYIKFTMSVETLDPLGVVIGEMKLEDCFISSIDLGVYGYKLEDNLYNYKVTITPNSIKLV